MGGPQGKDSEISQCSHVSQELRGCCSLCIYQVLLKGWWPTTATSCPAFRAMGLSIAPAFKHLASLALSNTIWTISAWTEETSAAQPIYLLTDRQRSFLKLLHVPKHCHIHLLPNRILSDWWQLLCWTARVRASALFIRLPSPEPSVHPCLAHIPHIAVILSCCVLSDHCALSSLLPELLLFCYFSSFTNFPESLLIWYFPGFLPCWIHSMSIHRACIMLANILSTGETCQI